MARTAGLPGSLSDLIDHLKKFPGVGSKTAQRLAFFILKSPRVYVKDLAGAILKVKEVIRFCTKCNNLSENEICAICADSQRERSQICVVEEPNDVIAIEKTGKFRGVYHVLLGALSPLDGIGPEELKINELVSRVRDEKPAEVILATNPDTEGETTALYLNKILKPFAVKVTRIGYGVPVGAELEYADQATLLKALDSRREMA